MTILLTGATGFIGRHVLSLLLARGDDVVSFGRARPLSSKEHERNHSHVMGDLATGANLDKIKWETVEQVVHLAAAGVKASRRAWPEALAVNVVGTQRLLEAVAAAPLAPRVFIARTFYEDLVEQSPALLENSYIATKAASTQIARLFADRHSGGVVFGNFFQVYGPGDDPSNVLNYAAREFQAGRTPVFGSGNGLRDWIYITDAAAAVMACLASPHARCASYDIGSGELFSIRQMVERLHALSIGAPAPVFDPSRDRPDVAITACARMMPTGWRNAVALQDGLQRLFSSI